MISWSIYLSLPCHSFSHPKSFRSLALHLNRLIRLHRETPVQGMPFLSSSLLFHCWKTPPIAFDNLGSSLRRLSQFLFVFFLHFPLTLTLTFSFSLSLPLFHWLTSYSVIFYLLLSGRHRCSCHAVSWVDERWLLLLALLFVHLTTAAIHWNLLCRPWNAVAAFLHVVKVIWGGKKVVVVSPMTSLHSDHEHVPAGAKRQKEIDKGMKATQD